MEIFSFLVYKCFYIRPYLCVPICLYVYMHVCVPIYFSVRMHFDVPIYLAHLFVYPSTCLYICVSVLINCYSVVTTWATTTVYDDTDTIRSRCTGHELYQSNTRWHSKNTRGDIHEGAKPQHIKGHNYIDSGTIFNGRGEPGGVDRTGGSGMALNCSWSASVALQRVLSGASENKVIIYATYYS